MMACDFVCQHVFAFFLCLEQMDPVHGVLSGFALSLVVYFSWFRHVTWDFFLQSRFSRDSGERSAQFVVLLGFLFTLQ